MNNIRFLKNDSLNKELNSSFQYFSQVKEEKGKFTLISLPNKPYPHLTGEELECEEKYLRMMELFRNGYSEEQIIKELSIQSDQEVHK